MLLNPNFARKAQREIDDLTNFERLPEFEDRDRLPYIDCILRETYR